VGGFLGGGGRGGVVAEVGGDRVSIRRPGRQRLLGGRPRPRLVLVDDRHPGALAGEAERDRAPDVRGAAGDDDPRVSQSKIHPAPIRRISSLC
jgi:hypothetical protein